MYKILTLNQKFPDPESEHQLDPEPEIQPPPEPAHEQEEGEGDEGESTEDEPFDGGDDIKTLMRAMRITWEKNRNKNLKKVMRMMMFNLERIRQTKRSCQTWLSE